MIIIDSKEASKNKSIVDGLKKLGAVVDIQPLPVADYYICGKYIVERKSSFDVAHSIRDRRLWNELLKMSVLEELDKWLLVEGSLSLIERFSNFKPESVSGALLSATDFGVKLFFTPSKKWTVIFLYRLSKKCEEKKEKIYPIRPVERHLTTKEKLRSVIEGIEGIGPQQADALLNHFRTLRDIANASTNDLLEVEGIGPKRAKIIYDIFRTTYDED